MVGASGLGIPRAPCRVAQHDMGLARAFQLKEKKKLEEQQRREKAAKEAEAAAS